MDRMRLWLILLFTPVCEVCLYSQSVSLPDIVRYLTGAASVEDISEEDMERYSALCSRPADINSMSDSRLASLGLFSTYQIASLMAYRSEHGNVMSLSELSMIDGFNAEFVNIISPFIMLNGPPNGMTGNPRWRSDIVSRAGVKTSGTLYGLRTEVRKGERIGLNFSVNHSYSAERLGPDTFTGSISFTTRKDRFSFYLGDYNARFGQGLTLWTGMTVGGLNSTSGFLKKQTGISQSSSFTGSMAHRGFAIESRLGPWHISLIDSFVSDKTNNMRPALNVCRLFRSGRLGYTHYIDFQWDNADVSIPYMNSSLDAAWCIKGVDLFSEIALDWVSTSIACLAGASLPISDYLNIASMLRFYPAAFHSDCSAAARSTTACTNEYSASAAADFRFGKKVSVQSQGTYGVAMSKFTGNISADVAYFPVPRTGDNGKSTQIKLMSRCNYILTPSVMISLRFSERIRTWGQQLRTELRTDIALSMGRSVLDIRADVLKSVDWAFLSYAEYGYVTDKISAYLRSGIFMIDDWDDRIYVYERDAPGSFSVPAFYGRGLWLSMTGRWKPVRWMKIYLRVSYTGYHLMHKIKRKPGKAELKLQCMFSI